MNQDQPWLQGQGHILLGLSGLWVYYVACQLVGFGKSTQELELISPSDSPTPPNANDPSKHQSNTNRTRLHPICKGSLTWPYTPNHSLESIEWAPSFQIKPSVPDPQCRSDISP